MIKINKTRLVLAILILTFLYLWWAVGDLIGAALSFIVLLLGVTLFYAIFYFLISIFKDLYPYFYIKYKGISEELYLSELISKGKIYKTEYFSSKGIAFEDSSTGCLVYLIEIDADQLLCLYGQYYYDFEPINDDPELKSERQFPTSKFTVLRKTDTEEVLKLVPEGKVYEPVAYYRADLQPAIEELELELKDGSIIKGMPLSEINDLFKKYRHNETIICSC